MVQGGRLAHAARAPRALSVPPQVDKGIRRYTHLGEVRLVKHPGRNLQPTVRIGTAQATAQNSAPTHLSIAV